MPYIDVIHEDMSCDDGGALIGPRIVLPEMPTPTTEDLKVLNKYFRVFVGEDGTVALHFNDEKAKLKFLEEKQFSSRLSTTRTRVKLFLSKELNL